MKVHVYIATTQGLVAVQRIHQLDPEISSVVSINGTSSIASISSAYHNFVKKGAGIIEADFGGQSYRVNIDAQIDQGNSWQLGLYLAHAAHARGILGDGKPQTGDLLICATGEVNTSDRKVMAVDQVPLKLDKANAFIEQLTPSVNLQFLLPETNYAAVITKHPQYKLVNVRSLDDALACLPAQAASMVMEPSQSGAALNSTTNIATNKWLVLAGLVLIIVLAGFVWSRVNQQEFVAAQPVQPQQRSQSVNSVITDGPTNTLAANDVAARLVLTYSNMGNCDGQKLKQTTLLAKGGRFAPSRLQNVCSMRLSIAKHDSSVIAINLHSHKIIRLAKDNEEFVVPIPANSANYIVLAFSSPLSTEEYTEIWSFLFNLPDDLVLDADKIAAISALKERDYLIFNHQLH
ncbi:hypothetical protein [Paraglaciecola sp.]|uniref:hypothetical protein n=1 Tax=Paraglaciecola sp. TaxID=1920173 RepID=UPI0030F4B29F